MVQPVVCGVYKCGVLAVGRCVSCWYSFCASHQGRDGVGAGRSPVVYVDLCSSCFAKTPDQEFSPKNKHMRSKHSMHAPIQIMLRAARTAKEWSATS